MVMKLIYILILADGLARCHSALLNHEIHLEEFEDTVRVINDTQLSLTLVSNEFYTFVIHSNTSYDTLLCHDKLKNQIIYSYIRTPLAQIKEDEGNYINSYLSRTFYTLPSMKGTWMCQLYYTHEKSSCTFFELKVDITKPVYGSYGSLNITQKTRDYYYRGTVPSNNVYPTSYGNLSKELPFKITFGPTTRVLLPHNAPENNDRKIHTSHDLPEKVISKSNPNESTRKQLNASENLYGEVDTHNSNSKISLVFICVVVALTGIILGVFIGKVGRKIGRRNTSTEERSGSRGLSMDHVYEELDGQPAVLLNEENPTLNVACRAPCLLPPEATEENQKYIHYDTPYDHRFDRPMPFRSCRAHHPQRSAFMLRRV